MANGGPLTISYTAGGALVQIAFDLTEQEQHMSSADVTTHAVEKGAPVTDHVRPQPAHLMLNCMVTNTPITVPTTNLDGATGATGGVPVSYPVKGSLPIGIPAVGAVVAATGALDSTETATVSVLNFTGEFDRVRSVLSELTNLVNSGTLVTVSTSLRDYENMLISSMTVPRSAKDGSSATFQLEAKEIRFVETKTVPVPKDKLGSSKKNKGPKPAEDAGEKKKSLLKKLTEGDQTKVLKNAAGL